MFSRVERAQTAAASAAAASAAAASAAAASAAVYPAAGPCAHRARTPPVPPRAIVAWVERAIGLSVEALASARNPRSEPYAIAVQASRVTHAQRWFFCLNLLALNPRYANDQNANERRATSLRPAMSGPMGPDRHKAARQTHPPFDLPLKYSTTRQKKHPKRRKISNV